MQTIQPELTILMPCLNEVGTVENCIEKAKMFLESNNIFGEILVADNNSADGSAEVALKAGARVINVPQIGYGNTIICGVKESYGKYIIVGDADESYDFSALMPFLENLRNGIDFVIGNRFAGGIKPGAMPFSHRYIGNPILTGFGNFLFGFICGDWHCGLRGFNREVILKLNLKATGMEFASEMVIKVNLASLGIAEIPTILWPSGRNHRSHIRNLPDGLRHLRIILGLKLHD